MKILRTEDDKKRVDEAFQTLRGFDSLLIDHLRKSGLHGRDLVDEFYSNRQRQELVRRVATILDSCKIVVATADSGPIAAPPSLSD